MCIGICECVCVYMHVTHLSGMCLERTATYSSILFLKKYKELFILLGDS